MDFFDQAQRIRQKQFIFSGAIGITFFCLIDLPMWFHYGSMQMVAVNLISCILCPLSYWYTRQHPEHKLVTVIYMLPWVTLLITFTCFVTWHITSVPAGYYVLLVLFSASIIKRSYALIYGVISAVLILLMPWLSQYSDLSPSFVETVQVYNFRLYIGYIALIIIFIFSSDISMKLAMERLNRSKRTISQSRSNLKATQQYRELFFAAVNHEIRNPTQIIYGLVELLKDQKDFDPSGEELLNRLDQTTQHLLSMVNDFLALKQIEYSNFHFTTTPFNVLQCVNTVIELMQPRAKAKNIEIKLDALIAPEAMIQSDETRLRQIFINLLSNALKFTPNGSITITIANAINLPIENIKTPQLCYEFRVIDTGKGIHPDILEGLFKVPNPNVKRISSPMDGFGLGLYISQTIIQQLGGTMAVERTDTTGTCIVFSLPANVSQQPG